LLLTSMILRNAFCVGTTIVPSDVPAENCWQRTDEPSGEPKPPIQSVVTSNMKPGGIGYRQRFITRLALATVL
jgi:hypothetical protein